MKFYYLYDILNGKPYIDKLYGKSEQMLFNSWEDCLDYQGFCSFEDSKGKKLKTFKDVKPLIFEVLNNKDEIDSELSVACIDINLKVNLLSK